MGAGGTVLQGMQKAGLLRILHGSVLITTTSADSDTALLPGECDTCLHLSTAFWDFP